MGKLTQGQRQAVEIDQKTSWLGSRCVQLFMLIVIVLWIFVPDLDKSKKTEEFIDFFKDLKEHPDTTSTTTTVPVVTTTTTTTTTTTRPTTTTAKQTASTTSATTTTTTPATTNTTTPTTTSTTTAATTSTTTTSTAAPTTISTTTTKTTTLKPIKSSNLNLFKCKTKCDANSNKQITFTEIKERYTLPPLTPDKTNSVFKSHVKIFKKSLFQSDASKAQKLLKASSEYIDAFWLDQIENGIEVKIPENTDVLFPGQSVPELYHYTWFSCHTFGIIHFISMLSTLKVLFSENAKIIFHTNCEPVEQEWYLKFKEMAGDKLIVQDVKIFDKVWGIHLTRVEHISDVYRILMLSKFGGIYCDDDMILLKSHQELFNSKVPVMGDAQTQTVANGFIITPKKPIIFLKWLQEYSLYTPVKQNFDWYSVRKIWCLWREYPDELTVLSGKLVRPGFKELDVIFGGYYNWLDGYNVHIYKRSFSKYKIVLSEVENIDCWENSLGEVLRHVVYGDHNLC